MLTQLNSLFEIHQRQEREKTQFLHGWLSLEGSGSPDVNKCLRTNSRDRNTWNRTLVQLLIDGVRARINCVVEKDKSVFI